MKLQVLLEIDGLPESARDAVFAAFRDPTRTADLLCQLLPNNAAISRVNCERGEPPRYVTRIWVEGSHAPNPDDDPPPLLRTDDNGVTWKKI